MAHVTVHPPLKMMLAGTYKYFDFPGAPAQLVEVDWVLGDCIVTFHDIEPGDEGLELLASDMAGKFVKV